MSSNPAVSIFAAVTLKDKGKFAKDAKDEFKEAQAALAGMKFAAVPITFDIPSDLNQKLQAKLANMKFTVPVDFVPRGVGVGVGGGGGWGFGGGYGASGYSSMTQSDRESRLFDTIVRRREMSGGGGNGPSAYSGGGAGGGGGGNLYNPFSPRGLARMAGAALPIYGGLLAAHVATGMIEAAQTASNPDRILREFDHVGARHGVMGDSMMQGQAAQLAGIAGEKKVLETLNQTPLLGTLSRFVDALSGATKGLEDQEHAARKLIEIHQYNQKTNDESAMRMATLSHDPIAIRAAQRKAEDEVGATALHGAYLELNNVRQQAWVSGDKSKIPAAEKALQEAIAAESTRKAAADKADEQAGLEVANRRDLSDANTRASGQTLSGIIAERNGTPLGAMAWNQAAEKSRLEAKIKSELADPKNAARLDEIRNQGDADRKNMAARHALDYDRAALGQSLSIRGYGDEAATIGLRMSGQSDAAQMKSLTDRQNRRLAELRGPGGNAGEADAYAGAAGKEREELAAKLARDRIKQAGDTAAQIEEIEGSANERMMQAEGHTAAAQMESVKRIGDAKVAELRRVADATTEDSIKQKQLRDQADAEEKANLKTMAALRVASVRESAIALGRSANALDAANMDVGGQHYGAQAKMIGDAYDAKVAAIKLKGLDPKAEANELATAANERDEATARLRAGRVSSNMSLANAGLDAAARSRGQEGVGGVLAFQEELRQKYRDAAGDNDQIKLVDNFKLSEIAMMRRNFRPHDVGMKYGGVEYHDILQQQINSGYGNSEAMQALNAAGGINARNAGTPEGALKGAAKNLDDVVKRFDKAVDKMNQRKAV